MIAKTKVRMELDRPGLNRRIDVVQGDANTRVVEVGLYVNGLVWEIPEDTSAQIRYRKPDGTTGIYDTLPDGTRAWETDGNTVSVFLTPQMLTVAGEVKMQVELISGAGSLATFAMGIWVEENPAAGALTSENYVNMRTWLLEQLDEALDSGENITQLSVGTVATLGPEESAFAGITQSGRKAVLSLGIPRGYVPQKGVDFWTESDHEQIVSALREDVRIQVQEAMVDISQSAPVFVNSIADCTDTTQLYVLPDGYLYAYMKKTGALFSNLANPRSSDWAVESRLNSSGSVVTYSGGCVSNWIDVTIGDVIRVQGLNLLDSTAGYIARNLNTGESGCLKCTSYASDFVQDEEGTFSYTIWHQNGTQTSNSANVIQVRLSGKLTGAAGNVIITKNEPIVYGEAYAWQNTGKAYQAADYEDRVIALEAQASEMETDLQALARELEGVETGDILSRIPDYWQAHLEEKISVVQTLQEKAGKDCFSFPLLTDIHISQNLGARSGLLAAALMNRCDMRYALCLGDVVTRGADKTAESMDASFAAVEKLLEPVRDRLLQTQGNHDGSWGAEDLDGDGDVEGTEFYCHSFTPQKLHSLIYRKVGLVGEVHFDEDGCGYYLDDVSNKVRYILLNSHQNTYAQNADGTAKYNNMRIFRFGQSQFDLVVEALTTVPGEDWAVVTASHVPLNDTYASVFGGNQGCHVLMRKLLAAYQNKTAFSGSFAGTYGDDAVSISADFAGVAGHYIAHFSGHTHTDSCGVYDGITVITTRCDGKEENDETLKSERVAGTITEQSFDIITVNRATGMVYATKIGAGKDRVMML